MNRDFFGIFEIPASIFQSVNPTFIIILGPLFASLWVRLSKAGKEPSTPLKFALGIFQLGLGFLVMVFGSQFVSEYGNAALIPVIFLVLGYFLHTTGELCLSPVSLSMVTKLAPKGLELW